MSIDLATLVARTCCTPDGCWLWTGHTDANGYPVLHIDGGRVLAHRAVHEAIRGPIPAGHVVRRRCHDPETCPGGPDCTHRLCVNPDHLAAGSRTAPPGSLMADVLDRTMITPDGCWLWRGRVTAGGYGRIDRGGKSLLVHRIAYESMHGPIPEGLVIDHLCHRPGSCLGGPTCPHRRCVNTEHLAAVTVAQNSARRSQPPPRTHCPQGHPLSGVNVYLSPEGKRTCRLCRRLHSREVYSEGMRVSPAEVRAWGRRRGFRVPSRGRLPAILRAAWDHAHPERPYATRAEQLDSATEDGGAGA